MLTIRPEHVAGWEHAVANDGAESVEAYAQARLDELGASYEAARQRHIRTEQVRVFELARKLPEKDLLALMEQVRTRATDLGLLQAEEVGGVTKE